MACCDNPAPRVLESSGRLFCGSCRRYLDSAAASLSEATLRVGAPHLPRCIAASSPSGVIPVDARGHTGDFDCDCPCHSDLAKASAS